MEDENDTFPPRCVSYLQARDSSILSWNRHGIDEVRRNLLDKFFCESTESAHSEKQDEGLNVYLRIKGDILPSDLYKIEDNTLTCVLPEESHTARNKRDKTVTMKKYKFTKIFGPNTTQEDLFNTVIKENILGFLNGYNTTLLTYGASGSGKTFTMIGTSEQPGIIPRALDYLFRTLPKNVNQRPILKPMPDGAIQWLSDTKGTDEEEKLQSILKNPQTFNEGNQHLKTYNEMQIRLSTNQVGISNSFPPIVNVWVSFAEIYNENIYDLLQPLPVKGQSRFKLKIGGLQGNTYIRGLKYIYVRSGLEAYQVLQYGLHNLSYAATAVNQHSSRSHCIFSIRLIAGTDERNCSLSVFNFCDLAGSERLKKTMNEGNRLKESTNINTSLSVLGRCISSVRDKQQNVKDSCLAPFRESKLTQLFQRALQGKEDILMLVNINPSSDMFDDTQHTLRFSAIAKQIITEDVPSKILKPSRFSNYHQNLSPYLEEEEDETETELSELRNQKAHLILELSEYKQQVGKLLEAERTHLRTNYDIIIEIKDKQLSDLRQEVENLKSLNKELKTEVRQTYRECLERRRSVIVVSSDDESNEENDSNVEQSYRTDIKQRTENELLSNELKELKGVLEDGKRDFDELLKEYELMRSRQQELITKNLTLEDQITIQNEELQGLRQRVVEQKDEIERLEDQNQKLLLSFKKGSNLDAEHDAPS